MLTEIHRLSTYANIPVRQAQNNFKKCGINTKRPTTTAEITKRRTAPAATSFAVLTRGSRSGDTLSHTFQLRY